STCPTIRSTRCSFPAARRATGRWATSSVPSPPRRVYGSITLPPASRAISRPRRWRAPIWKSRSRSSKRRAAGRRCVCRCPSRPVDGLVMARDDLRSDYEARRERALAMGGPERLARRRAAGWLDARERIARLLDPGSFVESGLFATSLNPDDAPATPADGKIAGFGRIDGRDVALVANDFTVKGASSGGTNMKK